MIFSFRACSGLMFGILVGFEMFKRMNLSRSRLVAPRQVAKGFVQSIVLDRLRVPILEAQSVLVQLSSARNSVPLSHDLVVAGDKYPWAKSTAGAPVVLRDRSLRSPCSAKRQAANS